MTTRCLAVTGGGGIGECGRLYTCYNAAYISQTQEQQRFTISEVAADWHDLMIPQYIMRQSTVRAK